MGWQMTVVQIEKTIHSQGIIKSAYGPKDSYSAGLIVEVQPVWNILYHVPVNTTTPDPLTACKAWIENNKVEGSKYVIVKMFFYE